jgi:hypothetical protein
MSFNIFISHKYTDENGKLTPDASLALEVYHYLVEHNLKDVFLSSVSLQKLGVSSYKKTIDNALDQASIMVVVGTSRANLESEWVRYEWDSFLSEMLSDVKPNGRIFIYISGMKVTELPRPLRQHQAFVHCSGSMEQMFEFIANAMVMKVPDIEKNPELQEHEPQKMRRRPWLWVRNLAVATAVICLFAAIGFFATGKTSLLKPETKSLQKQITPEPAPVVKQASMVPASLQKLVHHPSPPEQPPVVHAQKMKTGKQAQLTMRSKPEAKLTSIMVTTAPQGARIYIDGILKGTTPKTFVLTTGKHQVRIVRTGYQLVEKQITVEEMMEYPLAFNLNPIDEAGGSKKE